LGIDNPAAAVPAAAATAPVRKPRRDDEGDSVSGVASSILESTVIGVTACLPVSSVIVFFLPARFFTRYVSRALFMVLAMRKVLHATIRLPIL
jgi:hypothetical protein